VSEPTGEAAGATSGTREAGPADTAPAEAGSPGSPGAGQDGQDGASQNGASPPQASPSQASAARPGLRERTAGLARQHWLFALVLAGAAALRAVVMLGYPPIIWFHDSYSYLQTAVSHHSSAARPGGYPLFLLVLKPLHSFVVVALAQHLLGLGIGVAIYALLRKRGLPAWGATLAALPVLYDAYQVQLEQMVMSDVLFMLVLMIALVILCWRDKVGPVAAMVAGLLIGYASVIRSVGLPLIVLAAVCLLVRRPGWRPLAALVVAALVPIGVYEAGYKSQHGQYAVTQSDGIFLYGRVQTFATCAAMKPPPSLRVLCDPRPPAERPIATEYIWASNPLDKLAPHYGFFTPKINSLAEQYAERAILAQPFSYLRVVTRDTLRSFFWTRTLQYDPKTDVSYLFAHPSYIGSYRPWHDLHLYQPGLGQTRSVEPFAGFLVGYQRYVYLRGTLLGLILLLGLAGVVARWRRWGGAALLPWLVAAMLLVGPVATSGFSYRYELAVVPFACLAGGLAAAQLRRSGAGGSRLGWPAKIRGKLRRGRPVEQE
jgi:hypothetical protein